MRTETRVWRYNDKEAGQPMLIAMGSCDVLPNCDIAGWVPLKAGAVAMVRIPQGVLRTRLPHSDWCKAQRSEVIEITSDWGSSQKTGTTLKGRRIRVGQKNGPKLFIPEEGRASELAYIANTGKLP